jgi:hypothetical protein
MWSPHISSVDAARVILDKRGICEPGGGFACSIVPNKSLPRLNSMKTINFQLTSFMTTITSTASKFLMNTG